MFYNRLKKLCEDRNIKMIALLTGLGFSKGNVQKWRTGVKPGSRILQRLSSYFNVPVDYLLDKTDEKDKFFYIYNSLTLAEKKKLLEYTQRIIREKYTKN